MGGSVSGPVSPWAICQSRWIDVRQTVVWAAVGQPKLMSQWWCPPPTVDIDFESRAGGRFEERYDDGERAYRLSGTVVEFAPPRRFVVERRLISGPARRDRVAIGLRAVGGGTLVCLRHSFEDLPEISRQAMDTFYAEGWSSSLALLGVAATRLATATAGF